MLELRGLVVGRGGRAIAAVRDAAAAPGETRLILAPSGGGKTTALFTLAGLLTPIRGEVLLHGRPIRADGPRPRDVAVIFQDMHLMEGLSLIENVLLGAFARGERPDRPRARALLDRLGLGGLAGVPAERLSRGEAQRAATARALMTDPALILADEPTASLDDDNAARVADLLVESTREAGAVLVVATHDRRLAERFDGRLALRPEEAA